jgi:putative transposase
MKKTRFTESQIFSILKEYDGGKNIQEVSREHGVSKATIYNWKLVACAALYSDRIDYF